MKVYNYTPEDVGLTDFPQGELRLRGDDVEQVTDPDKADVFVLPPIIRALRTNRGEQPDWNRLRYLSGKEHRHVVYSVADDMYMDTPPGVIAFRCEAHRALVDRCPDTIPWPWPTTDVKEWLPTQDARVKKFDITFHGWVSSKECELALNSCERAGLNCDFRRDKRFWGHSVPESEKPSLKKGFAEGLASSYYSLCVRSIPVGVIRYRFYESMAMGTPILHVNDGAVYPLSDRIDYATFVVRVEEKDINDTGTILAEELAHMHTRRMISMEQYARSKWKQWLDSTHWPETMAIIVKEKIS